MRVSLSKICILSVFGYKTFNIVFLYVQEYSNERSELEDVFNQR